MQSMPLVSIICLSYNHEKFVTLALDSVLNQTYKNIELLIGDDCSPDNSADVIEKWLRNHPEIHFTRNRINRGYTKTFNSIFSKAKGDFVIDLAADDILQPDCIANQLQAFREHKDAGLVYGNMKLIDENGKELGYYYPVDDQLSAINPPNSGDVYIDIINQRHKICSVTAMMKRSMLDELGGYDETLAFEDLDIWIRGSRKYPFYFIDKILVTRRELKSSMGSIIFLKNDARVIRMNNSSYKIMRKAMRLNKSRKENKALLRRMHYEMTKALHTRHYSLFLKYIPLELKLRFF
ncbi:glycosyltransferase family 2 protein [Flavobacterium ardleyense]|uniref:glycosyltransferase family 2 protein n=1 Tax=Flavobacterium ardleyense TaxID=2038737 RepID=UPI00298C178F|nr:glycosyltransferase [Flavobacterium ardleyense]